MCVNRYARVQRVESKHDEVATFTGTSFSKAFLVFMKETGRR